MDKTIKLKIVRNSDGAKFEIGDGCDWKLLKNGLDGFGNINNTLGYTDNAIADGGVITSEHIGKVDRTIKFAYMYMNDNNTARRKAMQFFNVKDTFKVYLTYGDRTVWAEGKMYKMAMPHYTNIDARMDITVTFLFANPYLKSFDDFGRNIASVTGMTAFPYLCNPQVGGTTGGIFNFAQQVVLYNDGDIATYCKAIIQADGEVENPKLIINGEYVRVIDNMERGDIIVFDFDAFPPTVKKNGVNYIGHCDRTSAFDSMMLARGDNVIEYDADNGSSHMNVNVYYNKLYGAI